MQWEINAMRKYKTIHPLNKDFPTQRLYQSEPRFYQSVRCAAKRLSIDCNLPRIHAPLCFNCRSIPSQWSWMCICHRTSKKEGKPNTHILNDNRWINKHSFYINFLRRCFEAPSEVTRISPEYIIVCLLTLIYPIIPRNWSGRTQTSVFDEIIQFPK